MIWAVSSGVYAGWMTLLDNFLQADLSGVQIGWVGFGGNLAGAAGGVAAGLLVDKLGASLKVRAHSLVSSRQLLAHFARRTLAALCVARDSNSTCHPGCFVRAGVLTLSSGGHKLAACS